MTETPPETPDTADAHDTTDDAPTESKPLDDSRFGAELAVRGLEWAALLTLAVLALYALLRFYGSASTAISLWIAPEYEPFYQAAFNLVVLLVATLGVVRIVGRLGD